MDPLASAWYELTFRLFCIEKRADEFQDLFADIMTAGYPGDFIRVRPWGRLGDRKNDGYLKSKRMLFQVYAPNEMDANKAVNKINSDFNGALPYWEQYFGTWVFVHNGVNGLGPHIVSKLLELGQKHQHLVVTYWGFEELRLEMRQLDYNDLAAIFGHAPTSASLNDVGYEDLEVVLEYIAGQPPLSAPDLRPPSPEKLASNALSDNVESLLLAGMRKSDRVKSFFANYYDVEYGDRIAEAFKQRYETLKQQGLSPDQIFMELVIFAGGPQWGSSRHVSSVMAVLAHLLFEECDIFERSR